MEEINIYRGLKEKYNYGLHKDGLYFCTDTLEILHNGQSYGVGAASTNTTYAEEGNIDIATTDDINSLFN